MRGPTRVLLALGIVLFAATAWTEVERTCQHLRLVAASEALKRPLTALAGEHCGQVPADVIEAEMGAALARRSPLEGAWQARRWYPYALAPVWLAALALAWARPGWRRGVGAVLFALGVLVAAFEAIYLSFDYLPLLAFLGRLEVLAAWLAVVAVLFARRRDDRGLGAVEAHVAAQALLGVLHLLTLPASQARVWLSDYPLADVLSAVTQNFRLPFWSGILALGVAAGAVYLRRGAGVESGAPGVAPSALPVTASTSP